MTRAALKSRHAPSMTRTVPKSRHAFASRFKQKQNREPAGSLLH